MPATNPVTLPGKWSQVAFLARVIITVNKVQSPVTLATADEIIQEGVLQLKQLYGLVTSEVVIANDSKKDMFLIKWCRNNLVTYFL